MKILVISEDFYPDNFAINDTVRELVARGHDLPAFDIIYVWQVSLVTTAIPAIKVKKRYGIPLFLYCFDIWPEFIKAMGFKEESIFFKIIKRLSRKNIVAATVSLSYAKQK